MKTIYLLVRNKAWNESYAVDIHIVYASESKESVEKEMNRLINEDEDFNIEREREYRIKQCNEFPEWYKDQQSWDATSRRYVPYNVELELEEYKKCFYKSFWIKEMTLDSNIDLSMGSYYE